MIGPLSFPPYIPIYIYITRERQSNVQLSSKVLACDEWSGWVVIRIQGKALFPLPGFFSPILPLLYLLVGARRKVPQLGHLDILQDQIWEAYLAATAGPATAPRTGIPGHSLVIVI